MIAAKLRDSGVPKAEKDPAVHISVADLPLMKTRHARSSSLEGDAAPCPSDRLQLVHDNLAEYQPLQEE
ncbi:Hypp9527 [Branchiostoma lanceolatum]|uniref:Hypp9527 protein n=1 Tax=Branchiostoma lanceolatum TaxID=7740 RepID=A0A8S4MNC2_BRALA|nr:Hypp9527 [Branchiostoma lanceolatum]